MIYTTPHFHHIETLEDLKAQYKEQAFRCHPDAGGSDEEMTALNLEYQDIFRKVSHLHKSARGAVYERETTERAHQYPDLIAALLRLNLTVEVCGSWVWVGGDTRLVKDRLKALGGHWSARKRMWYFAPDDRPKHAWRGTWSMERIRSTYGSRVFEEREEGLARR